MKNIKKRLEEYEKSTYKWRVPEREIYNKENIEITINEINMLYLYKIYQLTSEYLYQNIKVISTENFTLINNLFDIINKMNKFNYKYDIKNKHTYIYDDIKEYENINF